MLAGCRILIVEHDDHLARDLACAFATGGAEVIGPYPRIDKAMAALAIYDVSGAALDVKLVDGRSYGIAISPDGARLYYAPLMSRRLYLVETAGLLDPGGTDAEVAASVKDLGEKGMTGGLTTDSKDRVYLSLQEHDAVGRRDPDGIVTVIASDPRLIWADTFWITPDRWLYISGSQVNRRPEYNDGRDLQEPPYAILRMRIDADPV